MIDSSSRSGAGSAASHLVTGHGIEHERLEEELATFAGRERALLFSTGYMAKSGHRRPCRSRRISVAGSAESCVDH